MLGRGHWEGLPDQASSEQRAEGNEERALTPPEERAFLVEGTARGRTVRWAGSWHVEGPARRPGCQSAGGVGGEEAGRGLAARLRTSGFDFMCSRKSVREEETGSNLRCTEITLAAVWGTDWTGWGDCVETDGRIQGRGKVLWKDRKVAEVLRSQNTQH